MSLIRVCLIIAIALLPLKQAHAQYFGTDALQMPFVGWMGLGTTASSMQLKNAQPWQSTDQVQIGFGYMHALYDYSLWWVVQTAASFGFAQNFSQDTSRVIFGVNASTGLRYNFMQETVRPFVQGQFEYVQFFHQQVTTQLTSSSNYWLGFLAGPGIEWIFGDDMGVQLEAGGHVLTDFSDPVRFAWNTRLSYMLYF